MIKKLSGSTNSEHDKEVKMMYEEYIRGYKSYIARDEDYIIIHEHALGGRGESSIIIY